MYVERGALVTGYVALLVGVALRKVARDGGFDRVPPDARAELLELISEIERAGRAWQARSGPVSGNPETARPEIRRSSALTAEQAAGVLNVSPRRVRQLAPLIGGSKAGGRWRFDADAVRAERERRRG